MFYGVEAGCDNDFVSALDGVFSDVVNLCDRVRFRADTVFLWGFKNLSGELSRFSMTK